MSKRSQHPVTDELLVRFLAGETSNAEREKVARWLEANDANRQYFETFEWVLSCAGPQVTTGHINEEEEWQAFKDSVQTASIPSVSPERHRIVMIRRVAIAAVLILLTGIGLVYLSAYLTKGQTVEFVSDRKVWTGDLPDGSGITLNKRSTLRCNRSYNIKDRNVWLTGEAFFAVAPNSRLPFIIHVQDMQVEVLGTSFNLLAAEDKTAIIVETGEVRVKKDSLVIYLHAGEKLTLARTGARHVKQSNTDPLYNYYRTKRFVCKGTPLSELVDALNNTYDQHIILADQRDGDLPITVTFTDNPPAEILAIICSTLQLTSVRRGDTIILKK